MANLKRLFYNYLTGAILVFFFLSFSCYCGCFVFWLICPTKRGTFLKNYVEMFFFNYYFAAEMALIKAVCTNQTVSVSVSLLLIGQSRLCKQWNVSRLSSPERAWSLLRTVVVWQRWTCGNAGRAWRFAVHCLLLPSPPPPLPLGSPPLQALQQCGSVCTALARLPLYSLHMCARISSHCRGSQWVHGIVVKQSPTPSLPWSSFSLFYMQYNWTKLDS